MSCTKDGRARTDPPARRRDAGSRPVAFHIVAADRPGRRAACRCHCRRLYISTNGGTECGRTLSAIGNSLGLVIEKPILELLDIDRDTELDMKTDGDRLIIAPVRKGKKERVRVALARALVAHDQSLRKLAE